MTVKSKIKKHLPWFFLYIYRKLYYFPKDFAVAQNFLFHKTKSPTTFKNRLWLIYNFYKISYKIDCPHTENEILTIAKRILNLGDDVLGVIVEAGSYYGGSTAKLSLVAKLCNRKLAVFDSFEGMPENNEIHGKSIFGREHYFPKGSHAVSLEKVKDNISKYGDISRCQFYKGWFSETMPKFKEKVAVACINVDLVQSTKDCLKFLYPLLQKNGIIFSQDGHFPWIINLLNDEKFWKNELGIDKPHMDGLGSSKLVAITFDK